MFQVMRDALGRFSGSGGGGKGKSKGRVKMSKEDKAWKRANPQPGTRAFEKKLRKEYDRGFGLPKYLGGRGE